MGVLNTIIKMYTIFILDLSFGSRRKKSVVRQRLFSFFEKLHNKAVEMRTAWEKTDLDLKIWVVQVSLTSLGQCCSLVKS